MSRQNKQLLNLHRLLSPEEVSQTLGVTEGTLQQWRTTGRYNLPYAKIGGKPMYRQEDLQAFIVRRLQNHTGEAQA